MRITITPIPAAGGCLMGGLIVAGMVFIVPLFFQHPPAPDPPPKILSCQVGTTGPDTGWLPPKNGKLQYASRTGDGANDWHITAKIVLGPGVPENPYDMPLTTMQFSWSNGVEEDPSSAQFASPNLIYFEHPSGTAQSDPAFYKALPKSCTASW